MSGETQTGPITAGSLHEFLARLIREGDIHPTTPIAVSSDPEGNHFRWGWEFSLEKFNTTLTSYELGDPCHEEFEPAKPDAIETLVLWPA